MNPLPPNLKLGTCSWNYPSWQGLVYSHPCKTAADYLSEYSKHYRTTEIDSWFYRIPSTKDVAAYKASVDSDFRFSCKVPQDITLTHQRVKSEDGKLVPNDQFLSVEQFKVFVDTIKPLIPQIDAIMFEFEYLNPVKMPTQSMFLDRLNDFFAKLPAGLPLAVECRNGGWLNRKHFEFLRERKLIQVFSEKQYMPHVYDVYAQHGELIGDTAAVIRLMGGDRKEMEELTGEKWDKVVAEKTDKEMVLGMTLDMLKKKKVVLIYANNHYEGSAPLTLNWFLERIV